jgi:hypothetical protein
MIAKSENIIRIELYSEIELGTKWYSVKIKRNGEFQEKISNDRPRLAWLIFRQAIRRAISARDLIIATNSLIGGK